MSEKLLLPTELWLHVFSYIENPQDLLNLSLVKNEWRCACLPVLYSRVRFCSLPQREKFFTVLLNIDGIQQEPKLMDNNLLSLQNSLATSISPQAPFSWLSSSWSLNVIEDALQLDQNEKLPKEIEIESAVSSSPVTRCNSFYLQTASLPFDKILGITSLDFGLDVEPYSHPLHSKGDRIVDISDDIYPSDEMECGSLSRSSSAETLSEFMNAEEYPVTPPHTPPPHASDYGNEWKHHFISSYLPLVSLHLHNLSALRLSKAQFEDHLLVDILANLNCLEYLDVSYSSIRHQGLNMLACPNKISPVLAIVDVSGVYRFRRNDPISFIAMANNTGSSLRKLIAKDNPDLDDDDVRECLHSLTRRRSLDIIV